MPQAVDNITLVLDQLSEQVRSLERRVAALEGQQENSFSNESQLASLTLERSRPPATWRGFPPLETPTGFVPVIGKAVLGIAGAYLLRALAESNHIPKLLVLFVAIIYACLWMILAVRVHRGSRFASATYALTSALILSPMLWESTVRFHVLSPTLAAAVTAAFVVLAIALAWKHDLQLIPWVATLTAVITAIALIIETHELVPLTMALLAVAIFTEATACLGHRLTLRAIPALAADFAVWLLIFILTSAEIPEGYHPASSGLIVFLCSLLIAIYGASIGIRSFGLRQTITAFEIAQAVLASCLFSYGAMRATHGWIAPWLGGTFLGLSAACYWGSLSRFTGQNQSRNRLVSTTWAAALLLIGSWQLFPLNLQIAFFAVAAVTATFFYSRTGRLSLGIHASVYLAAAVVLSRIPAFVADAFAGDVPTVPDWRALIVTVAAAVSYVIGSRVREATRIRRILWVIPGAVVGSAAAASAVAGVVRIFNGSFEGAASTLSVVRTTVNCVLAVTLALLGSRWKRVELGWLAYAALAFGTLKLIFEDLRFGNAASLVVSLLFYGLVLILLPRVTRQFGSSS